MDKINVKFMTDDELDDMMTNIINDREGTKDGTKKAERLDELYLDVDNEIQARKAAGTWFAEDQTIFDTGEDACAENDQLLVRYTYAGEGYNGDFDKDDEEDEPLLRVEIYQKIDEDPEEEFCDEPAESFCTEISALKDVHKVKALAAKTLELFDAKQLGKMFIEFLLSNAVREAEAIVFGE